MSPLRSGLLHGPLAEMPRNIQSGWITAGGRGQPGDSGEARHERVNEEWGGCRYPLRTACCTWNSGTRRGRQQRLRPGNCAFVGRRWSAVGMRGGVNGEGAPCR